MPAAERAKKQKSSRAVFFGTLLALALAAAATFLGYRLHGFLVPMDIVMLYLALAVIVAARLGRLPATVYSVASVVALNYFFIPPLFSFNVYNSSYWLTFIVMFFASLVISSQAAKLRDQVFLAQQQEKEARDFYELKLRNLLLSSISHDLRSPLAAISGAADTLLQMPEKTKDAPERGLFLSIRQEAARLTKIVNNMLDMNRMEGGQLTLNMQPYYPAEIIGSAADACRETLKAHKLSMHVADSLPLVKMDGLLISQVMQNLLENAARHTPAGTGIAVEADVYQGGLRVTVSDNGPGIAPGHEKDIFDKFTTAGDRPKGSGLGLAICLAIVTAHGGKIRAENKPDGGARFIVEFPAALTLAEKPEAA